MIMIMNGIVADWLIEAVADELLAPLQQVKGTNSQEMLICRKCLYAGNIEL